MIAAEPGITGRKLMASPNVHEFGQNNWQTEVVARHARARRFLGAVVRALPALTPTIERIADQFAGKVKVGKVNTDEEPDLAAKYAISFIPRVLDFQRQRPAIASNRWPDARGGVDQVAR